jgi:hypothetical protein
VPLPAEWELLGAPYKEPDESVRETVGCLGLGEMSQELLPRDVADDGDVGFGGFHRAVLG